MTRLAFPFLCNEPLETLHIDITCEGQLQQHKHKEVEILAGELADKHKQKNPIANEQQQVQGDLNVARELDLLRGIFLHF